MGMGGALYLDEKWENSRRREEKLKLTSGPNTGAVVGGVLGALLFICVIVTIIFLVRKRQEDAEAPPKHKPPPPVKAGSSTEMLNKPLQPPVATETLPLTPGEVYYEPTGEPITNVDEQMGGALNGGAPSALDQSLNYDDNHRGNDPDSDARDAPAANIARGESFVSPAMYV